MAPGALALNTPTTTNYTMAVERFHLYQRPRLLAAMVTDIRPHYLHLLIFLRIGSSYSTVLGRISIFWGYILQMAVAYG